MNANLNRESTMTTTVRLARLYAPMLALFVSAGFLLSPAAHASVRPAAADRTAVTAQQKDAHKSAKESEALPAPFKMAPTCPYCVIRGRPTVTTANEASAIVAGGGCRGACMGPARERRPA
jgi:hypothetical protein